MKYMFSNFLSSSFEFDNARDYWRQLCNEILVSNNEAENWHPWFEAPFEENDMGDNFPMYSMTNLDRTKGVVINQQDPKYHTKWEVAAWINTSEKEVDLPWPLEYFVYNCNLTDETAKIFKKLFEIWIQQNCSGEELKKVINEVLRDN